MSHHNDASDFKPKLRKLYVGSSTQNFFILFCLIQTVLTAVLLVAFSTRSDDNPERALIVSAVSLFVYFLVMLTFGLIFSNRVFGPLYRFEKHLRACAEKKSIEPIQFRKGDAGHSLAESFNILASELKKERS